MPPPLRARLVLLLAALAIALTGTAAHGFFCRRVDFAPGENVLENHISNVQQDSAGFMWFATWNGLVRFDGSRFHVFQPVSLSGGTIFSNRIYNLRVSDTGDLWCVSSDGRLILFRRRNMTFADLHRVIPEIGERRVKSITPMHNGATWIIFKDNSALRLDDTKPLSGYRFFSPDSRTAAWRMKVRGVARTETGDEWIFTDSAAVSLGNGRRVKGQYVNAFADSSGHTLLVGPDGRFALLSANRKARAGRVSERGVKVTYSLMQGQRVYLATDCGVWSVSPASGKTVFHGPMPAIFLYKDSHGRVWCFSRGREAGLIDPESSQRMETLAALPSPVAEATMKNPQLIFETLSGSVILKPAGGVMSVFSESDHTLRECRFADAGQNPWRTDDIKKFLVDNNRNLWLFHTNGAECVSFYPERFAHQANAAHAETRAVACDSQGRVWSADRSGALSVTEATEDTKTLYLTPQGSLSARPSVFSTFPVYAIAESPDGDMWIGTKGGGLYRLRPGHENAGRFDITHFSRQERPEASFYSPTDTVYSFAFTPGRVWIASYGGGLLYASRDDNGDYSIHRPAPQPPVMKVRQVYAAADSILLLATTEGLVTADMRRPDVPRFHHNRFRPDAHGLKGNDIMGIFGCDGATYLCVFGSGISRIDSVSAPSDLLSDSLRFTNYPMPSETDAGQIRAAAATGGCIWVMSERVLSRFSTASHTYATFTPDNFTGEFSFSEAAPAIAGTRMLAATSDGLLSFIPAQLETTDGARPRALLTGIRFQNQQRMMPLNDPDSLRLSPNQRSFTLALSDIRLVSGQTPRFRYIIEGYDQGWNYTPEKDPSVTYNNLPPGSYTLRIASMMADGAWHDSRSVHIDVTPRTSETWWFRSLLALVCAAAVCALAFAANHYKRMRNEIQKKYSLLMAVERIAPSDTPPPAEPMAADTDREFLEATARYIAANMDNAELVVEDLARHTGMSRTAYYSRMKQLTGLSPVDFIKQMRIRQAVRLLDEGRMQISAVAYATGFADPKYFSKCFKAEMGVSPSAYLASKKSGKQDV